MLDVVQERLGAFRTTDRGPMAWSLEASFEQEALPLRRQLYGAAYRITRSTVDAEDLVQETYLRAFRAFGGYRPGTNIRAWLFTILYRVRTDLLRKRGRSLQTVAILDEGRAVAPAQDAMAKGHEDVARALGQVPEIFRTAVLLRDVQELSYDEIGRVLDIPVGTVMSRIHRGRALLRKALTGRAHA